MYLAPCLVIILTPCSTHLFHTAGILVHNSSRVEGQLQLHSLLRPAAEGMHAVDEQLSKKQSFKHNGLHHHVSNYVTTRCDVIM